MNNSDREKFAVQMAGMQLLFRPDKPMPPETIEIYWRVFQGWDIERFISACDTVTKTKKISTFPLPGEIMEAGGETVKALSAWGHARQMVFTHGPYKHVAFEDYATHRAILLMGGWPRFCDCPDNDRPFRQREFERIYDMFKDSKQVNTELLPGLSDSIPENNITIPATKKLREIE